MTDWDKSTGSSGTMRIRDTGTTVEFWISSGNSSTFDHDMPWKYVVNGVTSAWKSYDYQAGSGFERLGSWTVTTDQTVTFYLGDTGTSGLGGPTTFSHAISRATVPPPPDPVLLSEITSTSMRAVFSGNGDGGAAIIEWQLGYGTNSSTPQSFQASSGTSTVTNLSPGTKYYFWARGRNSVGWGPWSSRRDATTLNVPQAPGSVTLSKVKQTSVDAIFAINGDGGSAIIERQIGYGTSSTTPQNSINASADINTITGLNPGVKYYFWARVRNSIGWSPYSAVSSTTLIAGAYVKVGTVWKRAVPYVKVNGVWKVAQAWAKVAGTWRETL